ncbi:TMEM175 family protein [Amnibacterium flavum]|uniref:TMEM175 family protein n=1 Tax=Amnibacterium flavum TaxID=2173173 RepID=UPI001401C955|nr:TMEM175 family protein [Amnibacterium flavum]
MNRERSLDRLITFCDAVVAIAITLLGLPLVDLAGDFDSDGSETVGELLASNWPRLFSFLLSFLVIAVFWMGHHRIYNGVRTASHGLVWVNVLWLIPIVFLPFPTELLATTGTRDVGISALYIGTLLVIALLLLLQVVVIRRSAAIVTEEPVSAVPSIVTSTLFAVALVIALLVPTVSLWPLLILIPGNLISGAIEKRLARRRGQVR